MRATSLIYVVAALASLTACATTIADLRSGTPFIETSTPKSAQTYGACLAERWSARSGQVNSTPRPGGFALTLTYPTYQGTINAATVDVTEAGTRTNVIVYARKGDAGEKLRSEVIGCL